MYPVTDALDVYALLGYAGTQVSSDGSTDDVLDLDENGFSWGLGAAYSFTDNISVFVDYVSLYDDEVAYDDGETGVDDITVDTWNFGVTYKF